MGLLVGRVTRDQEILGSISLHSKLFSIEPANLKFVRCQCSQRKNGETRISFANCYYTLISKVLGIKYLVNLIQVSFDVEVEMVAQ